MDVAIIGLGSMGKRRIRLIKELYPEISILGIDARRDRRDETEKQLNVKTLSSLDEVKCKIDCAFVCTSPLSHASIVKECLQRKWNVFTELNLVDDGYEENLCLAKNNGCILFLSSTFLYREEIKYIGSSVDPDKKWNYIYHIGQYLPDWHPWESYKDFFIGDKRTNGCREIMAIELPWLSKVFGDVEDVKTISDKMTGLSIDFFDNYMIQLVHKNGNKGCLIIDVVSPVAVRKFEAYAEDRYISWNGTPDSIFEFDPESNKLKSVQLLEKADHLEGYSAFVVENAYKNEIKEFFEVVKNKKQPIYDYEQDQVILKLIDMIGA